MRNVVRVGFVALASLASLAACVGDSSTAVDGGLDASTDTSVVDTSVLDTGADSHDAGVEAGRCNLSKPFGPLGSIALDTPYQEEDFHISFDGLTAYATAIRPDSGSWDLMVTTRATESVDFAQLTYINGAGVNTAGQEVAPVVTADGLTLYFARIGTPTQVYVATRTSTSTPFANPTLSTLNVGTSSASVVWISADALTTYIVSDRAGAGHSTIYVATRSSTNQDFSTATPAGIGGDPTMFDDRSATLTEDQLTIYFSSNRSGSYQHYVATRTTTQNGFGTPSVVSELSGVYVSSVSADGCEIYMVVQGPDAGSTYLPDIFKATKPN